MKSLPHWGATVLLGAPLVAWGLGLGDIELKSALNQPFEAEIELTSATPEELADLKVDLAARETFERYGLEIPANTWPGRVSRYRSVREACEAAVDAEIANAALYDQLMRDTDRPDILAVFRNLQRASRENHLQAFQRCVTRGGGRRAASA